MGQILPNDQHTAIGNHPKACNSQQITRLRSLDVCPAIQVPFYEILYQETTQNQVQFVYKFLQTTYVNVLLTHKTDQYEHDGVPFVSANQNVFGYKHKNSQKQRKEILFKIRIVGDKQHIINVFAQLKLLSMLEVGPYIGQMPDNSDGYITDKYIQFFGEVTTDYKESEGQKFKEKLEKVVQKIKQKSLVVDSDKITLLAFSPFQKNIIVKVYTNPKPQKNNPGNNSKIVNKNDLSDSSVCSVRSSILRNIRKQFDEQSIKVIKALDSKTNMLSSLQNLLIQKNIDKVIQQFQQIASNIDSRKQKLMYVDKFCNLVAQSMYFKEYQEQVISEALATSCILGGNNSNSILPVGQSFYSKKLQERLNRLRIGSTQFGSQKELQDYSQSNSMENSFFRMEQLKINIQGGNKIRIKEIIKEIKEKQKGKTIQDQYQVHYEYALMLMKSRKSRHALVLFQVLTKERKVPQKFKAHIYNLMGIIYYNREQFTAARRQFQNGLSKLLRIRLYSSNMALLYNNIGVTLYRQKMYDTSLNYFNKSLDLAVSCVDYRMMARSNRAVAFMDKNMLKQARNEFLEIVRLYEPANNASIICKTYTNLGYLDLLQKDLTQAAINLQIAKEIEKTCLITNGYKPSIYLHNNLAMLYYKKNDKRKALAHIEICKDQIETLKNLEAVTINFNFAMVYKQLLFHEFTLWHLSQCRRLLLRMPQGQKIRYLGKIQSEIDKINYLRIVEDSEESSCYNRQSFTSKYSTQTNRKHN